MRKIRFLMLMCVLLTGTALAERIAQRIDNSS